MPSGCAPIPTSFISITTSSSDRPLRDSLPNWGPRESSMSKLGLDGRHRNKDGEISGSPTSELSRGDLQELEIKRNHYESDTNDSADPYQTVRGWLLSYLSLTRGNAKDKGERNARRREKHRSWPVCC
jgi:hypothetical protein